MYIAQRQAIALLPQVYITPENGQKTLIFSLRRGESPPYFVPLSFSIDQCQHIAICVQGGCVTFVDTSSSYVPEQRYKIYKYP